jgi:hypothetical protein
MNDDRPAAHDFATHRTKTVLDYYLGIRGTRLRHAALAIWLRVRSCSLDEMWTYLQQRPLPHRDPQRPHEKAHRG